MREWKTVMLGTLLSESKIESTSPDTTKRIRVKLNVGGVEKRPDTNDKEGATKYYKRKEGQFIYGKQNLHKGAFGIIPPELNDYESSSDIPAFDVNDICYPEWIFYFFKRGSFYLKLESLAKGVGSKRIQPHQLSTLQIPLPPKEEQLRIIETLKLLENSILDANTEINNQLSLLSKLNNKFLSEAIQGVLTSKWRNTNLEITPAADLLEQLKIKKRELISSKKISLTKSSHFNKQDLIPFSTPPTWQWCRFENILESLRYGTSKKCDYNLGETPVLRIPNLLNGSIDLTDLKSTSLSIKERKILSLKKNDLLIIRSNGSTSLVGRSAVIEEPAVGYAFAGYLMRARLLEGIRAEYIHIVLESPHIRETIEREIRGASGVKNINSAEVNRLMIPIPPSIEQDTIIKKVKTLRSFSHDLRVKILESKTDLNLFSDKKISELFGNVDNIITIKEQHNKMLNRPDKYIHSITNQPMKSTNLEIEELLKLNGKTSAFKIWKMSKFESNIDEFYEELKKLIEKKKTVRESNDKGLLELTK